MFCIICIILNNLHDLVSRNEGGGSKVVHKSDFPNLFLPSLRESTQKRIPCLHFFPTVCFQMSFHFVCLRGCIITLITFVWLSTSVHFQMPPQMVALRGCIVTLATFVHLLSTVCFQVSPQIACIKRCKVTLVRCIFKLVAFVLLCDIVRPFHRGFHICIFYTQVSIFRSLLHFCFAVCKNFRLKRVQNLKKKP